MWLSTHARVACLHTVLIPSSPTKLRCSCWPCPGWLQVCQGCGHFLPVAVHRRGPHDRGASCHLQPQGKAEPAAFVCKPAGLASLGWSLRLAPCPQRLHDWQLAAHGAAHPPTHRPTHLLLPARLQKLADEGRLNEPVAKTLNAGVLAAAVGHLAGEWQQRRRQRRRQKYLLLPPPLLATAQFR